MEPSKRGGVKREGRSQMIRLLEIRDTLGMAGDRKTVAAGQHIMVCGRNYGFGGYLGW